MKWFRLAPAVALLGLMLAGCDSGGLKEGAPVDAPKESMTIDHREFMKKNSAKMQMPKGKPKEAEAAPKGGS